MLVSKYFITDLVGPRETNIEEEIATLLESAGLEYISYTFSQAASHVFGMEELGVWCAWGVM